MEIAFPMKINIDWTLNKHSHALVKALVSLSFLFTDVSLRACGTAGDTALLPGILAMICLQEAWTSRKQSWESFSLPFQRIAKKQLYPVSCPFSTATHRQEYFLGIIPLVPYSIGISLAQKRVRLPSPTDTCWDGPTETSWWVSPKAFRGNATRCQSPLLYHHILRSSHLQETKVTHTKNWEGRII